MNKLDCIYTTNCQHVWSVLHSVVRKVYVGDVGSPPIVALGSTLLTNICLCLQLKLTTQLLLVCGITLRGSSIYPYLDNASCHSTVSPKVCVNFLIVVASCVNSHCTGSRQHHAWTAWAASGILQVR